MPANIATTNGKPAFMFYGEEPWHRLGQKLEAPATAAEAITAAGLDYEITLTDVATVDGMMVPKTKAVVRYDNQTVLGVVSDKYCPVQNRQAFSFLDAVVADGGLRYHTAGALGRGEKVFLLAKLPGHIRVNPHQNDAVDPQSLLGMLDAQVAAVTAKARMVQKGLYCLLAAIVAFLLCSVCAGVAMVYDWFGLVALASGFVGVCLFIAGLGWAVREVTCALSPLEEETAYLQVLTSQQLLKSQERTKLKIAR